MPKPLVWFDEVADVPETIFGGFLPQPGKWNGGPKVSISTPPHPLPGLPERPAPRWRKDLRRAPGLSLLAAVKEIPFQCIHFEPVGDAKKGITHRMVIDGIRWRGAWALEVSMQQGQYQSFQSFHDPFPKQIQVSEPSMTLVATNFEAPFQVVTFELRGPWSVGELVAGGYTFTRGNAKTPLEMKVK